MESPPRHKYFYWYPLFKIWLKVATQQKRGTDTVEGYKSYFLWPKISIKVDRLYLSIVNWGNYSAIFKQTNYLTIFFFNQTHVNDIERSKNFNFWFLKVICRKKNKTPQNDFHVRKDYIHKFGFIPHFVLIILHSILNAEQLQNVMWNYENPYFTSLLSNSARLIDLDD